ncbi:MAG: GTP-binding protein, partial [Fuerstiella sp.]|nr:GTP-binding protein [Fuerstiella sp.]
ARRSLQGDFSDIVLALNADVTALRVYVEAAMDFPEEEIDFLNDAALKARLSGVRNRFDTVEQTVRQGKLLRDGVTVVLAGRPNAGKSSLLNALAGYDAAIVTDIPGTTRDLVREQIDLDGLPVHIIDTAGLRSTGDVVEEEGVRRAQAELAKADHALVLIDSQTANQESLTSLLAELPDGV